MSKTLRFCMAAAACLLVVACGTYYHRISYVPDANDPGWPDGIHTCNAGKIQTTGIVHEPKKFESLFGIPIPYNYNNQLPLVWLAMDSNILKEKACTLGLLSLEDEAGQIVLPDSVHSNLSSSYSGYDVFCFYYFPESVLAQSSYTLKFNETYAHCPIPGLRVSKTEKTGYRFEQVQ